jgi:hypothetical protein
MQPKKESFSKLDLLREKSRLAEQGGGAART